MNRLAMIAIGAALLAAFPLTHEALARGPARRVSLCHNTTLVARQRLPCRITCPDGTVATGVQVVGLYQGQVITVNANAAPAHLAHGDSLSYASNAAGDCRFRRLLTRCDATCDRPDGNAPR